MPRAPKSHDDELLYIARRLGESPNVKPATVLAELKAMTSEKNPKGRGYRKAEFLADFAGIKGTPQRSPTPGQIKGGLLSGVMRRKDVRAMSPQQQQQIKNVARAAIDATSATGDRPTKVMKLITAPGKSMNVYTEIDEDEAEDKEHGEIVEDQAAVASIEHDNIDTAFAVMDHIYDKLT